MSAAPAPAPDTSPRFSPEFRAVLCARMSTFKDADGFQKAKYDFEFFIQEKAVIHRLCPLGGRVGTDRIHSPSCVNPDSESPLPSSFLI
jgi:hypothetical protein